MKIQTYFLKDKIVLINWLYWIGSDAIPTPDFVLMTQRYFCLN